MEPVLLAVALAASTLVGAPADVSIGSTAPAVKISTWWNGGLEESTADFKGSVVLLEFFATW